MTTASGLSRLSRLCALALLLLANGCGEHALDPAPPVLKGILLQDGPGASLDETCAFDIDCLRPLRCLGERCSLPPSVQGEVTPQTQLLTLPNNTTLYLEIADDGFERSQGLRWRTQLAKGWGMLLIYPNTQQILLSMKYVEIPLDLLILNADGKVLEIFAKTPANSPKIIESSSKHGRYALEIISGSAHTLGIEVDTLLLLSLNAGKP